MNRRLFLATTLVASVVAIGSFIPARQAEARTPSITTWVLREGPLRGISLNSAQVRATDTFRVKAKKNRNTRATGQIQRTSPDFVGTFTGRVGPIRGARPRTNFLQRALFLNAPVFGAASSLTTATVADLVLAVNAEAYAVRSIRAPRVDAADVLEMGRADLQRARERLRNNGNIDDDLRINMMGKLDAAITRLEEGIAAGRSDNGPALEAATREALTLTQEAFTLAVDNRVQ